jgi:hypothetical protein
MFATTVLMPPTGFPLPCAAAWANAVDLTGADTRA